MVKQFTFSLVSLILSFTFSYSSGPKKNGRDSEEKETRTYVSPRSDSGLFSLLNLDFPGMEAVKKNVEAGDFIKAKAAYLAFRREKSRVKWTINPANKPVRPTASAYPQADRIMKHLIEPSMSAPEAFLGEDINWEFNPVSPTEPYFTKEWTWCNLNRMPFWNTLGRAYWHTLDEKFAMEWVAQMTDWVEDNPVPLDENSNETLTWRTIEAGIRMLGSWMNSYYYFLTSPSFTPEAHATFIKGVIEHGQKLEKTTLDFPERTGNWVAMECNGLGTIGILFPEFKMSQNFVTVAIERLNDELDKQVYPDGAEVELSPSYHQVSRYNFMELAKLAQMNNIALPDRYIEKMKKMYEFNLYLMDPTGNLPAFSDSDPTNVASSLREAYDIWKDPKFLFGATLGKEGVNPGFDSYFFNYAGYYVMRSGWNRLDNCLYFDAGPVGSNHEHEDKLNLYLYSRGKILLTEPGNYSYDLSKWRRFALSTYSHNTIIVDGKDQHRADIPESRLLKDSLKNPWVTSPLFDYGMGTYSSGYQENRYKAVQYLPREYVGEKDKSISHTRHVIFLKPYYYVVVDFLNGKGVHSYEAHFNLNAPDAKLNKTTLSVHTLRPDSVQLGLFSMDSENMLARIAKGEENPILGWMPEEKRPIPTVVYLKNEEAPATFSTLIYPYYEGEPRVMYNKIMTDNKNVWGEKIKTPHETIALVLRKNNDISDFGVKSGIAQDFNANAKIIIIREPKNWKEVCLGFYGLSEYKESTLAFNLEKASSLLMIKGENKVLFYNSQDEEISITFTIPNTNRFTLPSKKWMIVTSSGIAEAKGKFAFFNKLNMY